MRALPLLCTLACVATPAPARSQRPVSFAESVVANVVRIRAGEHSGFGFIVGLGQRAVLVATALHTLEGAGGDTPTICFAHRGETCATGSLVHVADAIGALPGLDLAIVSVAYPDGLEWRPDVAAERVESGEAVRSIGRAQDWYIPERAGHVSGRDAAKRLVRYTGLSVAEGVSGAPIVSERGIVAMHIESLGAEDGAHGIELAAIRERVEAQMRARWTLVPRADCAGQQVHRATLDGRAITMHFDANAPAAALQATARLRCLGARVTLRPVWNGADWTGDGITYRSGDVRLMRTVQTVLASLGRLDGRLGRPTGDLEVRVR